MSKNAKWAREAEREAEKYAEAAEIANLIGDAKREREMREQAVAHEQAAKSWWKS
jgi:hypothetical protein